MLTDEQIESIFLDNGWSFGERADMYILAGRAIEAAVRDQMLEADLAKLTERGAVAWTGIDAQDLRDGGKP